MCGTPVVQVRGRPFGTAVLWEAEAGLSRRGRWQEIALWREQVAAGQDTPGGTSVAAVQFPRWCSGERRERGGCWAYLRLGTDWQGPPGKVPCRA